MLNTGMEAADSPVSKMHISNVPFSSITVYADCSQINRSATMTKLQLKNSLAAIYMQYSVLQIGCPAVFINNYY